MAEFTLKRREAKKLKINIDDKSYFIPLSGSMKPKEVAKLDTVEATLEFMKKYIPEEVLDELTQDEYNDIVRAWGEASKEASGLNPGE
jgi:hypothetical protein